jgi:streptomycin 6-kinase
LSTILSVQVPDAVRHHALKLGPVGTEWLEAIPELLGECRHEWGLELGYCVAGFDDALVVRARRRGRPVTLQVSLPGPSFDREASILEAAHGRGYVLLYESDPRRGAMLLESLGTSPDVGRAVRRDGHEPIMGPLQLTGMLVEAWKVPLSVVPDGAEGMYPAAALRDVILSHPPTPGVPDCGQAIGRALAYAEQRIEARTPPQEVLVHGEPDAGRVAQVQDPRPGAESGYVLVRPLGLRCEREFDLGVTLRESNRELLSAGDPVVAQRDLCAHLAEATGTDAEAIWQWSFLQRVAMGLELLYGREPLAGRSYLQAATALISRRAG